MSGDRYVTGDQNGTYLVTFTVVDWVDVFTRPVYKNIIVDNLNFCIKNKGLGVTAWCLMSNHLHAILTARKGFQLSAVIRDYKKHTSRVIVEAIQTETESRREWMLHRFDWVAKSDKRITNYKFWQESNHPIYLDPLLPERWQQRINYIHNNPVRAGIVQEPEHYLYSSAVDFAGKKGLVNILPVS